jgi:hypothetical protein
VVWPGVFEKQPVVLDGSRRLVGLIVELGQIVMRRGVCRRAAQDIEQRFLGCLETTRTALGESEVDARIQVAWLELESRLKLSDRLVRAPEHEQGNAVVVVRARISRLNRGRALKLVHGFLEQASFLVKESEIVVGLCVQIVLLEKGPVALERFIEVTGALSLDREFEISVRPET